MAVQWGRAGPKPAEGVDAVHVNGYLCKHMYMFMIHDHKVKITWMLGTASN